MDKLDTYRIVDTLSKSQLDLILQVYDGAIAAFRAAIKAYQANDYNAGYNQLERAKRFVTHLYTTLDVEAGGEIAEKLAMLYAYIIDHVNLAEATKDLAIIDDNITRLDNIRQGWLALKQQNTKARATGQVNPCGDKVGFLTSV
ncbi:MAG: flagellar export chaperone FliS [Candidatus Zixiibacteriota bacterium]